VQLVILGLSHKTSPLDGRESFAVAADDVPSVLRQLCESDHIAEAVILSTCNRVEVYVITEQDVAYAVETLRTTLLDGRELSRASFESALYCLDGRAAIHHLLRVASSLDSMVLGEPQILGQVKEAVQVAREAGTVGARLGRIFDGAFSAAKAVRTETEIGRSVVSIGSVAADLAGKIFDDLASCRVLLVGAGKMAEATARSLSGAGIDRVYVANRSVDRAVALAQLYGWRARNFEELEELLVEADVVIMSTGARRPIIGTDLARRVIRARKYRPLFIVDIAVPRNVDPAVGDLDTLYVYNVDDLESASESNRESRRDAADEAETLVKARVGELLSWSKSLAVQPTLAAIRRRADTIARGEVEKTVSRSLAHLDDPSKAAVAKMAEALVAKILHPTMDALRNPNGQDSDGLLAAARLLHGVEGEGEPQAPPTPPTPPTEEDA
jgi:glutamyl-tRNA reductase